MPAILQLLGYVLLDLTDSHTIDTVGLYMTRAGALITWPLEDYLDLLGARRRDMAELRAAFARLLILTRSSTARPGLRSHPPTPAGSCRPAGVGGTARGATTAARSAGFPGRHRG